MHYDECSILLKKLNYPSTSSTCRRAIYSYALKSQQPERTRQTKNLTRTLDTGEGVKETPGKTSNTPTTAAYIYIYRRKEGRRRARAKTKKKLSRAKKRREANKSTEGGEARITGEAKNLSLEEEEEEEEEEGA